MSLRRLFVLFAFLAIVTNLSGDPASPITVTNTDSPDPVASGAELTYTITVVNTAGSKITNVVLNDQLNGVGGIGVPPQLVISSTRGSCTQSTTLVSCNAGTIEGGGSWFVTIRGVVTASSGTTLNNTATITGTHTAQNFTTTTTTSTLVSGGSGSTLPDLTISKNGPSSVVVSSPMTYTLTVNNIGTANATNVKVVDTVAAGLTGITATGTSLFTCGVAGQTVTCTGGAVNQGSNATITINATSPSTTGSITNTAAVDPDNTIAESNELNNTSALVNTQVTASSTVDQLSISVVDNPDPVIPGATLTYTILVTNATTQRADDPVIVLGTQGLDPSSIQVSQVVTNGTVGTFGGCTISAPQAKCSDRTLNAGGTIQMTVSGQVVASAGSTLIATGAVTGNIKNTGTSTTATQLTTVKPGIDLTVTNADSPDPVCARSWPGALPTPLVCRGGLTYTFVVGNSGIQVASGVTVRDQLAPGVVFDSFTAPAFSGGCSVDPATNVVTCTGGTIGPESTVTIIVVCVPPPVTGPITNTVTVDPNNAIFESDETNNMATQVTQVITGIDLTISKSAAINPIATSGTETYTILVNNLGTQDATGIRVRDTLPSGTLFRDVFSDHGFTCSQAGGVIECINGSIKGTASNNYVPLGGLSGNAPDTATITVRIFAQSFAGSMHNEVRVDPLGEIAEADETNNIATQDTVVASIPVGAGGFNQLTISKTQTSPDKTNTARNAKVTWSIVVGNTGTDTAVGITVRDFLPAGARYIEASDTTLPTNRKFNCSQVGGHIDCVGGEIPSLGTATITLTAFAPDTPGTYVNQAIVDPDNTIPEGDELDNQAFETTIVKNGGIGAFYELTISVDQTSPDKTNTARNALVTYVVTVGNAGSDDVIGVTVRDTLPTGSRFIQATGTLASQFLCSNSAGVVTCVGGQIPHGTTTPITILAFAPDTPATYTNQAIVDPDNTIPEGNEENNQSQVDTTVVNTSTDAYIDLTLTMAAPANTYPGGPIEYVLTVSNTGLHSASNVAVRDVLPAGVTFLSATDSGPGGAFTCSESASVVNCTGATIDGGGASRTITIDVTAPLKVVDGLPGNPALTNTATVDPDNTIPEGNELNNTDSKPTLVTSKLDLTITASGPTTASQNDVTDYTIVITNVAKSGGGQIATGVVMVDPLPVGLIPLAVDAGSGNNWACSISQNPINLVQCVGDLDKSGAASTVTIKVTVFITAQDGRSLDNTACVDPNNTIIETDEFNNCSEFGILVTTPIPKAPDLLVSKQVDSLSTSPGSDLTYTISISNVGDAKAKSPLTLTDTLPSEVTFTNFSTTNSWTCAQVSGTVTCHDGGTGMSPGETADVIIKVHVKDSASVPIANTAVASPAIVDDPTACSSDSGCANELGAHLDNNQSTIISSIGSSGLDLAISSITDNPDPVAPGQGLKYTIVAVNGGTAAANNVHIKVDIPSAGLTFMSADGSNGFNCGAPVSNSIDCVGDLPGGGNTTITVSFVVLLSSLPPDVSLTATIDPTNAFAETDEGNNTKTQVTTISTTGACSSCVDLVAAELIASPEPATAGGPLTVKFQIANVGDMPTTLNPASDVLLFFDTSSDGAIPAVTPTSSIPGITCSIDLHTTNILFTSCKGNLGPGQGATLTLSFPAVAGSEVVVKGTLDPNGLVFESDETNNILQQSIVVLP